MIEHLEVLAIGFLLGASATTIVYAVSEDIREARKKPRVLKMFRIVRSGGRREPCCACRPSRKAPACRKTP
jgi:hypothetical protein